MLGPLQGIEDTALRVLDRLHIKGPLRRLLAATPAAPLLRQREIRNRPRLVREVELFELYKAALRLAGRGGEIGDYLEFGVYNGTALVTMHKALLATGNRHSRLFGFDSFEGLPDFATTDCGGHWRPGEFASSLEYTMSVLDYEQVDRSRVALVKGYFSDTCTAEQREALHLRKASVVMVDCDLYRSTVEALAFAAPVLADPAVILFDDWYPLAHRRMGERQAFEEWLLANPAYSATEWREFEPYGKAFILNRGYARISVTE